MNASQVLPRGRAALLLTSALSFALPGVGLGGVIQVVTTEYIPGNAVSDTAEVFGLTSADITSDIFASIGGTGAGNPGYFAQASAGRFGQVGLTARDMGLPPGSTLRSEVLVASDEFVNLFGGPATARTSFIIDGGQLRDFFSTNSLIRFTLEVGAENVGPLSAETDAFSMGVSGSINAAFGRAGLLPGGGYTAELIADEFGNQTFATSGLNLDLRATFDPSNGTVEIPLSLQALDLGQVGSGDRLLIGYRAEIYIEQNGISEGLFGDFSDPFTLSGEPNPLISMSVTFEPAGTNPVPEPATAALALVGLLGLAAGRPTALRFRKVRAQPLDAASAR